VITRARFLREPDEYPSSILAGNGIQLSFPVGGNKVRWELVTPEGERIEGPGDPVVTLDVPTISSNGERRMKSIAEVNLHRRR
jgi:hypothetical protein